MRKKYQIRTTPALITPKPLPSPNDERLPGIRLRPSMVAAVLSGSAFPAVKWRERKVWRHRLVGRRDVARRFPTRRRPGDAWHPARSGLCP